MSSTITSFVKQCAVHICMFVLLCGTLLTAPVHAAEEVQIIFNNNETEFDPEFLEALRFAYEQWLTRYKTIENFRPYEVLTREQASKIVGQFAEKIMKYERDSSRNCSFVDTENADDTLLPHITASCQMWIFKGTGEKKFHPLKWISKAEAITVIIRMFNKWLLDESWEPRYLNYFFQAKELWLTKESNVFTLERPLTRYEMVLLLYRFYVKLWLLNVLEEQKNWLASPLEQFGINSVWDNVVVINTPLFLDKNNDNIFANIQWNEFRLEKEKLVYQFEDAYSRYGNVYSLALTGDDTVGRYVWVSTFNFLKEEMTDGNVRPIEVGDAYYKFSWSEVLPFYKVELIHDGNVSPIETPVAVSTGAVVGTGS